MTRTMTCDTMLTTGADGIKEFNPKATLCYMAAFAIAEGYGENLDQALATVSNPASTPNEKTDAVEAIKGAWREGLVAVMVNKVHQICDPYPTTPKTTLDLLENVGECLKGMCVYNEGC